jgi:hypothetical protein
MELGSYFLFLQEQIKDIIIISSARQSLRALVMLSSAPAPGAQSTWESGLGYRRQHLTVPISTND